MGPSKPCGKCGKPVDSVRAPFAAVSQGTIQVYCSLECSRSRESKETEETRAPPIVAPVPGVIPYVNESPRVELAPGMSQTPPPVAVDASIAGLRPSLSVKLDPAAEALLRRGVSGGVTEVPSREIADPDSAEAPNEKLTEADREGPSPALTLRPFNHVASPRFHTFRVASLALGLLLAGPVLLALLPLRMEWIGHVVGTLGFLVGSLWCFSEATGRREWALYGLVGTGIALSLALRESRLFVLSLLLIASYVAFELASAMLLKRSTLPPVFPVSTAKTGELVSLVAGDVLPFDATVVSGVATLCGVTSQILSEKRQGDGCLAGSRIVEGELRLLVANVGDSRFWARTTSSVNVKQFLRTHILGGEVLDRFLPLVGGLMALAVSRFSFEGALMALAITASLTLFSRTKVREIALRQWAAFGPSRGGGCELSLLGAMRTSETICFNEDGAVFVGGYDLVAKSVSSKQVEGEIRAMLEETGHPLKASLTHEMASIARIRVLSSPASVSGLIQAKTEDGLPILFGARESLLAQGVGTATYEPFVRENDLPGAEVWFAAKDGEAIACFIVRRRLATGLRTAIARVQEAGLEAAMRSSVSPEMGEALGFERVLPEVGEEDERTISIERPSAERGSVRRAKRVVLGGSVDPTEACVVDSDSPLDAVNVTLAILRAAKLDHVLALVGTLATLFALLLAYAGWVSPFGFLAAMVLGQCAQVGILLGASGPTRFRKLSR